MFSTFTMFSMATASTAPIDRTQNSIGAPPNTAECETQIESPVKNSPAQKSVSESRHNFPTGLSNSAHALFSMALSSADPTSHPKGTIRESKSKEVSFSQNTPHKTNAPTTSNTADVLNAARANTDDTREAKDADTCEIKISIPTNTGMRTPLRAQTRIDTCEFKHIVYKVAIPLKNGEIAQESKTYSFESLEVEESKHEYKKQTVNEKNLRLIPQVDEQKVVEITWNLDLAISRQQEKRAVQFLMRRDYWHFARLSREEVEVTTQFIKEFGIELNISQVTSLRKLMLTTESFWNNGKLRSVTFQYGKKTISDISRRLMIPPNNCVRQILADRAFSKALIAKTLKQLVKCEDPKVSQQERSLIIEKLTKTSRDKQDIEMFQKEWLAVKEQLRTMQKQEKKHKGLKSTAVSKLFKTVMRLFKTYHTYHQPNLDGFIDESRDMIFKLHIWSRPQRHDLRMQFPCKGLISKRDLQQFCWAKSHDYVAPMPGDEAAQKTHQYATEFEDKIAEFLHSRHIRFIREDYLQKTQHLVFGGSIISPDFILLDHVMINGHRVQWIDVKNKYGGFYKKGAVYEKKERRQGTKYFNSIGPGAFLYKLSFCNALPRNKMFIRLPLPEADLEKVVIINKC